jgi:BNR repeat-like domain
MLRSMVRRLYPRHVRAVCLGAVAFLVVVASVSASADSSLLTRLVSRDTTTTAGFQHQTVVEPSIAAGPAGVLVTVFQLGRGIGRGAAATGFATSRDGGRSWRKGLFTAVTRPGLSPATPLDVTDAIVTYDWVHHVWLVASVADFANGSRTLQIHRSTDGLHWSGPVEAGRGVIDHDWIACDRWAKSPFRGRCYVSFTRQDVRRLGVRWSVDGGSSWSGEGPIASSLGNPNSAFPVVRPDGRLVVVFREGTSQLALGSAYSVDGGRTFSGTSRVALVKPFLPPSFRGVSAIVPSVVVGAGGRLYAVWQSCRFRPGCRGNDLVLSRSSNGVRWTAPTRVPLDRRTDHVIPGLGIASTRAGRPVRLGLAYYTIANEPCLPARCRIAPYFVSSPNGGRTWSRALRLQAPMRFTWLAQSPAGEAFVADNIGTAFYGSTAWPAFTAAARPSVGELHESVHVARVRRTDLGR